MWKKLDAMYVGKMADNKVQLIRRLANMKYVDGTPIAAHLNEFHIVLLLLSK